MLILFEVASHIPVLSRHSPHPVGRMPSLGIKFKALVFLTLELFLCLEHLVERVILDANFHSYILYSGIKFEASLFLAAGLFCVERIVRDACFHSHIHVLRGEPN